LSDSQYLRVKQFNGDARLSGGSHFSIFPDPTTRRKQPKLSHSALVHFSGRDKIFPG